MAARQRSSVSPFWRYPPAVQARDLTVSPGGGIVSFYNTATIRSEPLSPRRGHGSVISIVCKPRRTWHAPAGQSRRDPAGRGQDQR